MTNWAARNTGRERIRTVSYTHLDVYKRQRLNLCISIILILTRSVGTVIRNDHHWSDFHFEIVCLRHSDKNRWGSSKITWNSTDPNFVSEKGRNWNSVKELSTGRKKSKAFVIKRNSKADDVTIPILQEDLTLCMYVYYVPYIYSRFKTCLNKKINKNMMFISTMMII